MIDLVTPFLGPMAWPECRRAARRPRRIVARTLAGVVASAVVFVALWAWWIFAQIDPEYLPYKTLRIALYWIESIGVTIALVLTPGVLAGSLAGEKERGSIGLLLATDASPRDIVLGRLAGGLGQILMLELAIVPALLGMAALAGFGLATQAMLLTLPAAVAFGAGGIALAASALSRKGRDALMLVYLILALAQLAPLLGPASVANPFAVLGRLIGAEDPTTALLCAGAWSLAGLAGLALASWRLRPAALSEGEDSRARRRARRLGRLVPEVDADRPMLWKERYIERAGTLGGVGRWVGGAIAVWLIAGSVTLGAIVAKGWWTSGGKDAGTQWALDLLAAWFADTAEWYSILVAAAIGLRAAVTIASERERGTWDGLLTSPLEGGEIVVGKLLGSLRAVRWLAAATVLSWTIAAAAEAMSPWAYVDHMVGLAIGAVFMAALGVRVSLHASTATRAMAVTLGIWLVSVAAVIACAAVACLVVALACWLGWLFAAQLGLVDLSSTRPWFPMSFEAGFTLVGHALTAGAAIAIVAETRMRFDRIAGRMTAGTAAIAVDRLIHGGPVRPVRLPPTQDGTLIPRDAIPAAVQAPPGDQAM